MSTKLEQVDGEFSIRSSMSGDDWYLTPSLYFEELDREYKVLKDKIRHGTSSKSGKSSENSLDTMSLAESLGSRKSKYTYSNGTTPTSSEASFPSDYSRNSSRISGKSKGNSEKLSALQNAITNISDIQSFDRRLKSPRLPDDMSTIPKDSTISTTTAVTETSTPLTSAANVSKISGKSMEYKNKESKNSSDISISKGSLKSKVSEVTSRIRSGSLDISVTVGPVEIRTERRSGTYSDIDEETIGNFSLRSMSIIPSVSLTLSKYTRKTLSDQIFVKGLRTPHPSPTNLSKIPEKFSESDKTVNGTSLSSYSNKEEITPNSSIIPEHLSDLDKYNSRSSLSSISNNEKFTPNTSVVPEHLSDLDQYNSRSSLSSNSNNEKFTPNTSVVPELNSYMDNSMDRTTFSSNSHKGRFTSNISEIPEEFSEIDKSVGGTTLSSNSNNGELAPNTSIIPEHLSELDKDIGRSSLSSNSNKGKFIENTSVIPKLSSFMNNSINRTTLSSDSSKERLTPNTSIIPELTIVSNVEKSTTETTLTKRRFTPNTSVIPRQQSGFDKSVSKISSKSNSKDVKITPKSDSKRSLKSSSKPTNSLIKKSQAKNMSKKTFGTTEKRKVSSHNSGPDFMDTLNSMEESLVKSVPKLVDNARSVEKKNPISRLASLISEFGKSPDRKSKKEPQDGEGMSTMIPTQKKMNDEPIVDRVAPTYDVGISPRRTFSSELHREVSPKEADKPEKKENPPSNESSPPANDRLNKIIVVGKKDNVFINKYLGGSQNCEHNFEGIEDDNVSACTGCCLIKEEISGRIPAFYLDKHVVLDGWSVVLFAGGILISGVLSALLGYVCGTKSNKRYSTPFTDSSDSSFLRSFELHSEPNNCDLCDFHPKNGV